MPGPEFVPGAWANHLPPTDDQRKYQASPSSLVLDLWQMPIRNFFQSVINRLLFIKKLRSKFSLKNMAPLRILCFGNSLSCGWMSFGAKRHPYAINLKEQLLSSKIPAVRDGVLIDVEGLPGDLVNCPPGRFLDRMKKRCLSARLFHIPHCFFDRLLLIFPMRICLADTFSQAQKPSTTGSLSWGEQSLCTSDSNHPWLFDHRN